MRRLTRAGHLLLLLFAGCTLPAATIRGTVIESQTGHPLARAAVTVQAIGGGSGSQFVRTNPYGNFEFPSLAAGTYVISASRLAFAPAQYGQKRWYSSGMPIVLTADDSASLMIRLPRFGAIAGTLLDENEVGLPDHQVAVYTNTRPPVLLARARTDDRGMYRLFGLRPGSYLVRSLSKVYEDETYLPTFYRDAPTVDQAHPIEVTLDEQVDHVDFHAAPGRLYTVTGRVSSPYGPATVTMTSDTGTETAAIDSNGDFHFNPTAPGQYELLAVAAGAPRMPQMAAFQPIGVDRDTDVRLSLNMVPTVQFTFEDAKGQPIDPRQLRVMARRKDLAGDAQAETLQVVFDDRQQPQPRARRAGTPDEPSTDPLRATSGRVPLMPGRWDVAIAPGSTYCVLGFSPSDPPNARADGWNEILLTAGSAPSTVKFVLSSSPGTLTGTVKNSGGDPVAGVPVYIEPYDLEPRRRLAQVRSTRTNGQGQYALGGLAPGVYRLLASFDYQSPDPAQMEAANAKTIKVEEGVRAVLDLDEFVIH